MAEQPYEPTQEIPVQQLDMPPYQQMSAQANQMASDMISQIDPAPLVEMTDHYLRGDVWDRNKQEWLAKYKPYMNDLGISRIIATLRPIASINTTISYLEDWEVRNIIIELNDELAALLTLEWKTFEAQKPYLTSICNMICRMAFMSLKRAFEGGDAKLVKGTTVRHEQMYVNAPQKKDSIFTKINPFK